MPRGGNGRLRLYRRRNRVTTLWGNGVVSLVGCLNIIAVSVFSGRGLFLTWGLWWVSTFTRLGRRLMVFNSSRIWIRGYTPRFGKPCSELEVRFLRKRYALIGPSWIGHGLRSKFYLAGRWKAFREWDVGLLTGRDLQTCLLY